MRGGTREARLGAECVMQLRYSRGANAAGKGGSRLVARHEVLRAREMFGGGFRRPASNLIMVGAPEGVWPRRAWLSRSVGGLAGDGEEELELGGQLVLGVQSVREVDSADAAVGVDLDSA